MAVAAFEVRKLSKNTFPNHPEAGHLKGIIAAVFQHHAVHAGAFCGVYKRPAFLYGNGGRHLQGNILAAFHGIDSNLGMELPGGSNIHKVNVRKFAEAFPAVWSNEFKCLGAAPVQERFLAIGHRPRIEVAQCHHGSVFQMSETLHGRRASHSKPHKAHSYFLNGLTCKTQYRIHTTKISIFFRKKTCIFAP
jgi:hypothetical protein